MLLAHQVNFCVGDSCVEALDEGLAGDFLDEVGDGDLYLKHVFDFAQVRLHHLKQLQRRPEQNTGASDHEIVPDHELYVQGQVVHKQTNEPLGDQKVNVELKFSEVRAQFRKFFLDDSFEDFDVDRDTEQVRVLIKR